MKSRRTLLVRTGHGSAGVAAVPGMPGPASDAAPGPADVAAPVPDVAPDLAVVTGPDAWPGAGQGAGAAADAAVTLLLPPVPAAPSVPMPPMPPAPPDLPPVSGPAGPAPLWVTGPVAAVEPDRAPVAIPERPAEPPAIPAPTPPAGPACPVIEPLFTHAPGLNWAGPGDHWSRAWALQTLGEAGPAPAAEPAPDRRSAVEQLPTARDIELIRDSLAVVEPVADRATAHFYALIFLHHPEVRSLFPAAMDVQRDRLFRALLTAARSAGDPEGLRTYLSALGRGHRRYGTLTGHYGPVGECLVQALAKYAGSRWDAGTELAWRRVYRLVSSIMIGAAEEAARTSPPWWQGEVVAHERRTRDVAVLTVRPDQAYPYRAGQYTSLETPWWPRVWRHFSFASAPGRTAC